MPWTPSRQEEQEEEEEERGEVGEEEAELRLESPNPDASGSKTSRPSTPTPKPSKGRRSILLLRRAFTIGKTPRREKEATERPTTSPLPASKVSKRRQSVLYLQNVFSVTSLSLADDTPAARPATSNAAPSKLTKNRKSAPVEAAATKKKTSARDSGYYSQPSVSPTPSIPSSLSSSRPSLALSPRASPALALLRQSSRGIEQALLALQYQEELGRRFAVNVEYLLAIKQDGTLRNRKMQHNIKEMNINGIAKMRSVLGRVAIRKGWIAKRSQTELMELSEAVDERQYTRARPAKADGKAPLAKEGVKADVGVVGGGLDAELRRKMAKTVKILRSDVKLQRQLDRVLRDALVLPCTDERLIMGRGGKGESVALRRFVMFVQGRDAELGRALGGLEACLLELEGLAEGEGVGEGEGEGEGEVEVDG